MKRIVFIAICSAVLTVGLFLSMLCKNEAYSTCKITGARKKEVIFYIPFWVYPPTQGIVISSNSEKLPSAIESFLKESIIRNALVTNEWNLDSVSASTIWGGVRSITPRAPGRHTVMNSFGNEGLLFDFLKSAHVSNTNFARELQEVILTPDTPQSISWRKSNQLEYYRFFLDTYLKSKWDAVGIGDASPSSTNGTAVK